MATGGVITGGGGSSRTRKDFEITSDDLAGMTSALAAGSFAFDFSSFASSGLANGTCPFAFCLDAGRFTSGFWGDGSDKTVIPNLDKIGYTSLL